MFLVTGNSTIPSSVEEKALTLYEKLLHIPSDTFWSSYENRTRHLKTQVGLIQKEKELEKGLKATDKPEGLSLPQNPLADNKVQFCTQLLGHSTKADIPPDQMRLLALETINANYPADQWFQVFTDGSHVENQAHVGAGVYSELFTFFAAAGQNRLAFEGEIEAIKVALGQLCCQDTKFTNVGAPHGGKSAAQPMLKYTVGKSADEIGPDNPFIGFPSSREPFEGSEIIVLNKSKPISPLRYCASIGSANLTTSSILIPNFDLLNISYKTVVLGDFNAHSTRWGYKNRNTAWKAIEDIFNNSPLELIYSDEDPATYLHYNETRTTPDLFLVSNDICELTQRKIIDYPGSGHKLVIASSTSNSKFMTSKMPTKGAPHGGKSAAQPMLKYTVGKSADEIGPDNPFIGFPSSREPFEGSEIIVLNKSKPISPLRYCASIGSANLTTSSILM
nr:hypothetical transcript [Hymenolepis microstoma]